MNFETIKSYFNVKHSSGNSHMATCPCHDDKKASLSISCDSKNNRTLLYCHAGCDTRGILSRVGLEMKDLYEGEGEGHKERQTIEAVYRYTGPEGNLLFEKVRFRPKSFSQRRHMDGCIVWGLASGRYYETYQGSHEYAMKERKGAKVVDLNETKPVLYNLPGIMKAAYEKGTIYIVEGEKDADNLIRLGITATTSFDGASKSREKQKWRAEYSGCLSGVDVVLIPDNDSPGRAHMMNIARELKGFARSIKLVELPVPQKEDVSYYLSEGHSLEELLNLVRNTVIIEQPQGNDTLSLINYNFSDVGNAERLIALYGSCLRYCSQQDRFLIWSGRYWKIDNTGTIFQLAKSTLRRLLSEGEALDDTADESLGPLKKNIKSFVLKSENDARIKAMVNQTKSQREIILTRSDMDPSLLSVGNGTLDLHTGTLFKHSKGDYITRITDIDYVKDAACDEWMKFLHTVFQGDDEIIDFVQRSVGYSLTGSQKEQCFYMLYGSGANGKSTFLNAIRMAAGEYSDVLKPSSLMAKLYEDGARGDLAKLCGKRFVATSELNDGQYFDESLLKSITGGEKIPVRFLYGEEFLLNPEFKLWIGTNEKPRIKGTDLGIWRRVRMVPFLHTFSESERDKDFFDRCLVPELPGILRWAVDGCVKFAHEGINIPSSAKAAVLDYKSEMDTIQRFIEDCCDAGDTNNVRIGELYDRYLRWCKEVREPELTAIKFGRKIKEKGFNQVRSGGLRYWSGISLLCSR